MENGEIKWMYYQPKRSGGSISGSELGQLCRIDGLTFMIPSTTAGILGLSQEKIDVKVKALIDDRSSDIYALTSSGEFSGNNSEFWKKTLENSIIGVPLK